MKVFEGLAGRIYDVPKVRKVLINPLVRNDMGRLHPGEDVDKLCKEYYVDKLVKSLIIILAGFALAVLLGWRASGERKIDGNELRREDVLGEAQTLTVETVIEGHREQFVVELSQEKLTEDEAEVYFEEFRERLPELIVGENQSVEAVVSDLQLLESYEGYPFWVEWRSDAPECISSSGAVVPGECEREVMLRAIVSYGEQEWEERLAVRVLAEVLTPEQRQRRELENQLIITQENTQTEETWILPDKWGGKTIQWQRVVEDNSIFLWIAAPIVAIVVYFLGDKDLHQEIKMRQEKMRHSYPDIVHKLALYLGAGMTLQGAFGKIAAEYEEGKARGQPYNPAYEEMLYTCREMKSGVPESSAYERFGLRIGLQEYIRLGTLMAQNLKKGSSSLLERLQEEADRALVVRIQSGRKLGEEASTKLLVPMVMMLGIVMVMVMLPAFNSMGL